MKDLQYLKDKIANEKRFTRSISLPQGLWAKYEAIAKQHELNLSDVVEEALRQFDADLSNSNTMPQEAQ